MVSLHPASLSEIRDNWQFFVTGVGEVIDKCQADFHPADVYREVTSGGAHLYWIEDEGETVGFTVLTEYIDRYSRKSVLSLDMTYLIPNVAQLEELGDAVLELASELGKDRIEWFSPRVGWTRVMDRLGYQSDSMLFSREVSCG
jgi:hypothetical protein